MQIDHVSIPVTDLTAARAFYERALAPLGVQIVAEFPSGIVLGGSPGQGIVGLRQGTEYRAPCTSHFPRTAQEWTRVLRGCARSGRQ
jgi:catechol 2,3-dioxygenase-like lactoylglutathione lyase family enzyme